MVELHKLTPGTYVWITDNGRCIGAGRVTNDPHDRGELPVQANGIGLMRVSLSRLQWHPQNNWGDSYARV